MYRHVTPVLFAVLAGLAVAAGGRAFSQELELLDASDVQLEFPKITRQPEDQAALLGSNVTFSVTAENGDSYQWSRNGVELQGETGSSLTLKNVKVEDVGLYSCSVIKGGEEVPTRTANLNVMALGGGGGQITVYGAPIVGGGGVPGGCPGPYVGYVNFFKPGSQWGWVPTITSTIHTATDTNRTDTSIVYLGRLMDSDCDITTVAVPHPTFSLKYRFTVFFPDNVPTNTYSLVLEGFNP